MQLTRRVGRPERPVDPGVGPEQQLALALRRLRQDSGDPTYRVMAERAHYSVSALARAASGAALPSRDLVLAYVRACGGDQAEWERRWEAAAAQACQQEPRPASPGQPGDAPADRPAPGWRRAWSPVWLARAGAALLALAAILLGLRLLGPSRPAAASAVPRLPGDPSATSASAAPVPGAQVGIRRHGSLTMVPGEVADLDSMAANWAEQPEPGPATADIWFGATDHALHGVGNNDIAVLPSGRAGGFWACALEQDYGVTLAAAAVRPGTILCGLTAADRVAELRVTGVHRDVSGTPDWVSFEVIVWVQKHRT